MEILDTPPRWNLNNLQYSSNINNFIDYLSEIKEELIKIETYLFPSELKGNDLLTISRIIRQIDSAESFYYCLTTENIEPSLLTSLNGGISILKSKVKLIISNLQEALNNMNDKEFNDWTNEINHENFIVQLNTSIDMKNTSIEENHISIFSKETLRKLEDIYLQVRNNLKVKIQFDNEVKEISFYEANDLAMSHPEHYKRNDVFKNLNHALQLQSNNFASLYNQMVGLRLQENSIKSVDYLEESLLKNGISKPILSTMWDVVESNLNHFSRYLEFKAIEEGEERLSWHELMAAPYKVTNTIKFSQALEEIKNSLVDIDKEITAFVNEAISKRWVDAEPRDTKPSGGFCAPFITEGESRISISYDNSIDSARRLAHELGHAWHFYQLKDVPTLRFIEDTFEMTMAETASIFFESAFIDHLIENTKERSFKKAILGSKIERSLNYLMSIRAAFLFETKFYEFRKKGQLDVNQMEELSLKCQQIAYNNSLREYEPFVWIKYEQFYQANVPFYNYPYSIGFLLSIGLLEGAKLDKAFHQKFRNFLSETGSVKLEQSIKKHFNIDLSQPEFWEQSIEKLVKDIDRYINME